MASVRIVIVGVTENGDRVGDSHQKAKLSDKQVDLIRDMYEEGMVGYRTIGKLFGVSKNTIRDICKYRRRTGVAKRYKRVCIADK